MSDLLDICDNVEGVASDIAGVAQRLNAEAQRLQAQANHAASVGRGSPSHAPAQVAATLQDASRKCRTAAESLAQASAAAERFVATHRGLASVRYGSGSDPSFDAEDNSARVNDVAERIISSGSKTQAGIAFFAPGDQTELAAQALPPMSGHRTYDLHGDSDSVSVWDGRTRNLDAKEFAAVVRADPDWDEAPIRLFSCNTGKGTDPFAQQLADELGVNVVAPTELAWSGTRTGESFAASGWIDEFGDIHPTHPPDGDFVTFRPRNP